MNTQIIKKGRMPGSAMKSGAITALVVGSIAVVIGMLIAIGMFAFGNFAANQIAGAGDAQMQQFLVKLFMEWLFLH
ncbi:hypothetical protein [Spiroplasma endosymbiont of Dasysyrphus albostriatus]|uniref:hypothetical protein n=1 Tax=Spiroplasma endosymbiont of Dasysyrphus albostriatus TaxID=3066299 RepID=UPI0030CEE79C